MKSSLLRWLRALVILFLVVLAFQFELGMAINLGPILPNLSAFGFSIPRILQALQQIGAIGPLHAGVGVFLLLLALLNLILALASKARGVIVFGVLGFLSTILEMVSGILFTLSGFQNDGYSHGMATNFLLSFIFFFIELYLLKPVPRSKQAGDNQ